MATVRSTLRLRSTSIRSASLSVCSRRVHTTSRGDKLPQSTAPADNYEDFYRFTGGRWLWAEEERLQERYKKFNVPGLKRLAAEVVGADSCVSISKLAEGGFNKVFRLAMDDGSVVIARIPNPNVGPVSKVMASEVATMEFARNVLELPVPKVLAWDGGKSNSVESEYMLMEEAKGTQLEEVWSDMDLDEKFKVVDDVVAIQQKLQSVASSRYGSLYFRSDAPKGCSDVEVLGDLPSSARFAARDRFVIGPVADQAFWETQMPLFADRGPWRDAQGYLHAISHRERMKMPAISNLVSDDSSQEVHDTLDSPQARLSLLDKFDAVSSYLPPNDPSLDKATLSHWDLRAPNMFVQDGRITGLIDWQDAWVGPLFMQERRPHLIDYHGEFILRLPDYYETMEDKDERDKLTERVEKSILLWYYGQQVQEKNPTLQTLFDLPLARKRRETALLAAESWEGETIPLRECLYHFQRNWDKLDTGVQCPISFTKAEIEAHDRASVDWNERADFWSSLDRFVSREGFTSNENYEEARKMFEGLRDEGLASLSGAELAEFREQSRWAERSS